MAYDECSILRLTGKDEPIKAPFIWQGGKTKSLKDLLPWIPYREGYVEPFGGSGAVLLAREPSGFEVFNDRNSGLIDFYKVLKSDQWQELVDWIDLNLSSRELFLDYKHAMVTTDDILVRAGMWFYLQQQSFGGLGGNWGRGTKPGTLQANKFYKNLPLFPRIHERLRDVQIENRDYLRMLEEYDTQDTVFYLDPPYLSTRLLYEGTAWTRNDQLQLLKAVFAVRGCVVLSGYNEPLNDKFPFDETYTWSSRTTMGVSAGNSDPTMEKIWIKY